MTVGHGVEGKQSSYVNRFFHWVNSTFPNPKHQLVNKGIPGATSGYVAPCVLNLLPENPDLVILVSPLPSSLDSTLSSQV